jgi:RNA polymerase sigma factor (sigma-70 family)
VDARAADDSTLVERAKEGDERAFDELVRAHQATAFRTAYLFTGTAADAEEAVQTAFIKAWRALGRFRRGAPFKPWLLRIVANEARNLRRSASRYGQLALRVSEELESRVEPAAEQQAIDRDSLEKLLLAVNRLDQRDRDVLTCRFFLDLSERETAEVLEVRQGTVKSRTSRALERLREAMA